MTTSEFDADRGPEPLRHPDKGKPGGRRRRRATDSILPEAEFTSYYGRSVVRPAPWGPEIAGYLFFGGMAAGSGIIAAGADLTGRTALRRDARYAALVALGAGSIALVKDLGRPERALNMMRTAKLTSPMSVGSWILAGFGTFTGGAAALELVRPVLPAGSRWRSLADVASPFAGAGAAFFAPPLAAYTAVLLSDTATPLWNQSYRELPFLFCASATGAGAGLNLILAPAAEAAPVRQVAALAAAADLAADALMERRLGEEGQPLHEGRAKSLHTAARVLTAAGGLTALVAGRNRALAAAGGAALIVASACTRFAIWHAGTESAKDPVYTVRPQRRRAEAKRLAGQGVTQPGGEWPV